jgi:hypothetical protein
LTIVKPLLISSAAVILITVLAVHQEAFAMHDSNSTINTWITRDGTVAQTIDLNHPTSPVTPGEDTVGVAAAEEEPSVEPPTTTTGEDEEEGEEETTTDEDEEEGEEETTTDEDEEEGEATETENG